MFDIAPTELLVVAIVALVVIGPKDLPKALRFVGNWVGKARRMAAHFRAGVDNMVREAELEELKKDWEEQNRRIMAEFPNADDMSPSMREANPGFPAESAGGGAETHGSAPPPVTDGMVQAPADAPSGDGPQLEAPQSDGSQNTPKSGGAGL